MMVVDNAILESLIQDGRTIELINGYVLNCCNIVISSDELKERIKVLYKQNLLKVDFPQEYANVKCLKDSLFTQCWFGLSAKGEKECIKRNLMLEM